ncbi:MFS transporter [Azospirillum oryzae]|uniref:MFS transporter n=1 Tax=Azospirillum oryzae TaxID=286727 RepID=UPI001ABFF990|nr:MFS transporter [Azospirillum oryzae]
MGFPDGMNADIPVRPARACAFSLEVAVPNPNPSARLSPFAPLRHGIFRAVWLAVLVSNLGGLIQSVGAAWLMTSLTGSISLVALVQASTTLPIMLFSLAAGAIADGYDKRAVMLVAQAFTTIVSILLAACTWFGLITPWALLVFTFLIGCGTALNNPAWQSSVRDMVPRPDLPQAIGLNSVGMNLARSVGPAFGGMIVATVGAAAAFAVNAFSYLPLMVVLFRWRPEVQERLLPRETLGAAMGAGIRFAAMSPRIRSILVRGFVFAFAAGAVQALMPLVARDLVGGGPVTFGLLFGAFGIGAIGGGLFSSRIRQALGLEGMVRAAFAGFAVCALLTAISASTPLTIVAMAMGGASWLLVLSSFNVAIQTSSPRWVVGRILALYQTAAYGGIALGSWIWGSLAERFGIGQALALSALVLVLAVLAGLRWAAPKDEEANWEPLNRWKEPSIAMDIQHRSGPIVVTIEYRIHEKDVPKFLSLMAERRRIRRRDGARHWHLLRDLAEPELWTERYDTPTWLDYVRQAQRITQADASILDQLKALHRGFEPPRISRRIERQPVAASLEAGDAHEADYYPTDPPQTPS